MNGDLVRLLEQNRKTPKSIGVVPSEFLIINGNVALPFSYNYVSSKEELENFLKRLDVSFKEKSLVNIKDIFELSHMAFDNVQCAKILKAKVPDILISMCGFVRIGNTYRKTDKIENVDKFLDFDWCKIWRTQKDLEKKGIDELKKNHATENFLFVKKSTDKEFSEMVTFKIPGSDFTMTSTKSFAFDLEKNYMSLFGDKGKLRNMQSLNPFGSGLVFEEQHHNRGKVSK